MTVSPIFRLYCLRLDCLVTVLDDLHLCVCLGGQVARLRGGGGGGLPCAPAQQQHTKMSARESCH